MIWVIGWLTIGFLASALITWLQLRGGEDVSLRDGFMAIVATFLGPIFAVSVICHFLGEGHKEHEKVILIKANKKP